MSNKETLITDNMMSNNPIDIDALDVVSTNNISIYDIALLLYSGVYLNQVNIKLFDYKYHVGFRYKPKGKVGKIEGIKKLEWKETKKALKRNGWLKETKKFLNPSNIDGKDDKDIKERSLVFSVYEKSDYGKTGRRNFTISFDKYQGYYRMHSSASPSHLLSSQNVLGLGMSDDPKRKADILMKLFILPLYVLKKICQSSTNGDYGGNIGNRENISFSLLQLAAYSRPYNSVEDCLQAMKMFYEVYCRSGSFGEGLHIDLPHALGYSTELSKSIRLNNKGREAGEGERAVSPSGFMLRKKYGSSKNVFSLGFYLKDVVERQKVGDGKGKQIANNMEVIGRCIRLDLTLFSQGIINMCNEYKLLHVPKPNSKKTKLDPSVAKYPMNCNILHEFFEELFKIDITGGILFSEALENQLQMSQLMLISRKQWEVAFDYLKEKGYYEILEGLTGKDTDIIHTGSWKSLVDKQSEKLGKTLDPSRESKRILKLTTTDKLPGINIHKVNYACWLAAQNQIGYVYSDPQFLNDLYSGKMDTSNMSKGDILDAFKAAGKEGRKQSRKACYNLTKGRLHKMDVIFDVSNSTDLVERPKRKSTKDFSY